jgi:hypothetical protein
VKKEKFIKEKTKERLTLPPLSSARHGAPRGRRQASRSQSIR